MFDFHERRRFRRYLYSKASLFILLILLILMARGVWEVYDKSKESNEVTKQKQAELKDLSERQEALAVELAQLDTDRGVEQELREKYDVAKPGEKVIVLVPPPSQNTTAPPPRKNLWQWFLSLFGK